MGGLKNSITVTHVRSWRNAQPADLRGASVRNVIAVEIWSGKYGVLIGAGNDLLEDRVGDAIVDHQLFLPCALAVSSVDLVENAFYFLIDRLPEFFSGKFQAGLNQVRILFNGEVGILVFVIHDPALAFGDYPVAEFFGSEFIPPLAESALGKFLNISLMHQSYGLTPAFECELDGHAHQALRPGNRNRFDTYAGIQADLLLTALQHVLVEKLDEPGSVRSSLLPFDSGVDVFGILAVDDDIHAFGMFHRRWRAFVILDRAYTSIEIENLAQCDIQGADPAAHRSGQRSFDRDTELTDCIHGIVR